MDKTKWLRVINPILLMTVLAQTLTGLVFFFRLKVPGKHLIFDIHRYNGLILILLAVIHLTLNWNWVRANYLTRWAEKQ